MTPTKADLTEYFAYLDGLRKTGAASMFGARPYLMDAFDLDGEVAGKVLVTWMETFDGDKDPAIRAAGVCEEKAL